MASDVKVEPCPFCKGEGEISYYARTTSPDAAGFFVECIDCAASGPGFDIQGEAPDRDDYTKAKAIAAWNQRIPATDGVVHTPVQDLPVDSGMSGEAVASAEWAWANLPAHPKWTSLTTAEKALACHTFARLSANREVIEAETLERAALSHEQADTAGRAAYEAYCAMDPIEPRQPDWGRQGYKIEAAIWQAVARAAIRALGAVT